MSAIFMLSFLGGVFMLLLGFVRMFLNGLGEVRFRDGNSAYRRAKHRGIRKHFLTTAILFVIAALTQFA